MSKDDVKSIIAGKLKEALYINGLNRIQFAQLMGVEPSRVTRWLSGTHNFTIKTISEIESKLNIRILNITHTP